MVTVIVIIIVGFVAGIIAKFLRPGPNEPWAPSAGSILDIAGALVAAYLGPRTFSTPSPMHRLWLLLLLRAVQALRARRPVVSSALAALARP